MVAIFSIGLPLFSSNIIYITTRHFAALFGRLLHPLLSSFLPSYPLSFPAARLKLARQFLNEVISDGGCNLLGMLL